ncbi:MAG TPA: hypothetical protein PK698_07260 [Bacilli bacterium]|jgi:hypothetical protein|nr:MAG: hypothetical protein BWX59_02356 [Bacteroidetes bacterium ADurb.Bin028]HOH62248.1 hypothetical protein [Bacilli bacterium]
MKIIKVQKFGKELNAQEHLLGKHREHCLCWLGCKYFKPNTPENCEVAQKLFQFDIDNGVTTPVWECIKYES